MNINLDPLTAALQSVKDSVSEAPRRNRFDDAIEIQEGAVNVRAMANALQRACAEIDAEKPRVGTYENDPAVLAIVHQLAFIVMFVDGAMPGEGYQATMDACRDKSIKYRSEETNG